MAKFMIEFTTDNSAFDENKEGECARILKHVAKCVEAGRLPGVLFDRNGNRIGEYRLEGLDD